MEEDKTLTDEYERLRHSTDSEELSRIAREELKKEEVGEEEFAIRSALLEAVAANKLTPKVDRIYLASASSFPNILVRLSTDEDREVRKAVAANKSSKNWLLSKLAKDEDEKVREEAIKNPNCSWKAKLDAAQNPLSSPQLLRFLSEIGKESAEGTKEFVLSSMVRSSTARNPSCPQDALHSLMEDNSPEVRKAAEKRVSSDNVQ
ncbi:MAG: AbrB family transcriptional regulator [Aeriscardovia sp.]|nr:AbrB family transcriptional regulator [Aeriscardovia sp.]MBQ1556199.1 AbrB family transcriptional regulator [Aeriscardovia sp.]